MLSDTERDLLRWTAGLHGQTVAQVRRRIATGFLDYLQDHDLNCTRALEPAWDLRLSRDELTAEEMRLVAGLAQNYEDALDRLCVLWVQELIDYADNTDMEMQYDQFYERETGEVSSWWP